MYGCIVWGEKVWEEFRGFMKLMVAEGDGVIGHHVDEFEMGEWVGFCKIEMGGKEVGGMEEEIVLCFSGDLF